MRAKPGNLKTLDKYFDTGKDFSMTQEELEKVTVGSLSKNLSYVKNSSALAKRAKSKGYYIDIEPLEIKPMTIHFKKKK